MKKTGSNIKNTGRLLLLILIIMASLIYINNLNIIGSKSAFKALRPLQLAGQIEAEEKSSNICRLDELLVEAQEKVIKARNIQGESVWSRSFAGEINIMKSSNTSLYIIDSSKKIYCMSKSGQLMWEKELEGEVNEIYIDENGDMLIEYRIAEGAKLHIFSSKGIDEGSMMLDKAAILDFASGDGENTISVVDISTEIVKTKLITFNLKGSMIWSENFDGQIIPMISYGKDNTLIAIGESTIYKYKGEDKNVTSLEAAKTIYSAAINEDYILIAVRSRYGFDVISYDINLKEIGRYETGEAPKGIFPGKSNYILYYDEKLLICDLKGIARAEYKSIPAINGAYFTNGGNIIAISDRMIQKLNYQ